MIRLLFASLFICTVFANVASAIEIKNIRACYGPFGATRTNLNLLPGDVIFITYDVEGLTVDPKSGKTKYETTLEFLDANEKVLFKMPNLNELVPRLGGGRMPGDLHLIMGAQQAPGKYFVKLTVFDKLEKDPNKAAKAFKYPFTVLPQGFGFVGATVAGIGFPGQTYLAGFGVVNLALNGKGMPNTEITIKILDDKGQPVAAPFKVELPRDLPADDAGNPIDLKKSNFVPIQLPLFLNRPGRFTVEVFAHDKLGNTKAELRYPLTVLDVNSLISK